MSKKAVICYLSSLLFYAMGYSTMLVLNTGHVNPQDYTAYVSLATVYFVLTILSVVMGSIFLYVKIMRKQEITEIDNLEFIVEAVRGADDRRRANLPEVIVQLSQSEYCVKSDRRMSSSIF